VRVTRGSRKTELPARDARHRAHAPDPWHRRHVGTRSLGTGSMPSAGKPARHARSQRQAAERSKRLRAAAALHQAAPASRLRASGERRAARTCGLNGPPISFRHCENGADPNSACSTQPLASILGFFASNECTRESSDCSCFGWVASSAPPRRSVSARSCRGSTRPGFPERRPWWRGRERAGYARHRGGRVRALRQPEPSA